MSRPPSPVFDKSVFINCPFDEEYRTLLRPLLFTVHGLGMIPRFSLERADSGETRIGKIIDLIKSSKWGIHDLSRCKSKEAGEFYRMNMPLELGLDIASREFGGAKYKEKQFLILEEERYRFQQAVSDLSGSDIKAHKTQPLEVVRIVSQWLAQVAHIETFSPTVIWNKFNYFMGSNYDTLSEQGYTDDDIKKLPDHLLSEQMRTWLLENPLKAKCH